MKLSKNTLFYILICSFFMGIVAPSLFSDGMFADGVDNATIARNMANGLGDFWQPHHTNVIAPEFYEHPPLAFGLQSIWFRLLGDSIYIERFYSLTTFIIVGFLIVLIWREMTNDFKTGWLPLLFWVTIPKVSWACANNMLENTMSVFVTAAALFYLKSLKTNRVPYIVLCGLSMALGLLSKGFFALFIWSFPLFVCVFKKEYKVFNMVADTVLIVLFTAMPIYALFVLYPEAANSMINYFDIQILGRMLHDKSTDNRFYILYRFTLEILPPLLIGLFFIFISWKKNIDLRLLRLNLKKALAFFLLTLSGVIPIMISLKQSSFYILAVFPFFALSLGYFLYPLSIKMMITVDKNTKFYKRLVYFTCGLFFATMVVSVAQIDRIGRDHNEVADCYLVIAEVGKDKTINICEEMFRDWSLHSYYARYGNISLDSEKKFSYDYYLTKNDCDSSMLKGHYKKVLLKTIDYHLYKKTD
jgi:4-amino-4-deoxy-L-arabinose transferase-like glycosyltransferase